MRTVGDLVAEISGQELNDALLQRIGRWPPDVFALCASLLAESGAYRSLVSPPSGSQWPTTASDRWTEMVERLSAARPATLAAAGRVRGITPAALTAILLHANRRAA